MTITRYALNEIQTSLGAKAIYTDEQASRAKQAGDGLPEFCPNSLASIQFWQPTVTSLAAGKFYAIKSR